MIIPPPIPLPTGAQLGDVQVDDIVAGNVYHGVPANEVLPLLDRRMERLIELLSRLTVALVVQAVVLSLLLLVTLQMLVILLSPHLVAIR